jgi:putative PIN family toxin of toxin-antitoxin system
MRLVLDTNVVASAILWGGRPRLLLHAAREKRVQLFTSVPMLRELSDILERPKFARKIAASGHSIDQLVDGYALLAAVVRPRPLARIAPDPDDDMVIATALGAAAELIVTGDKALRSVGWHGRVRIVGVDVALACLAQR